MFIAFSGLSGSGKDTVMNSLIKNRNDLKILYQSTATTRLPREDDKKTNTYVYLSKEQFERGIKDGLFIEYELVHDNYYGTLKEAFEIVALDKTTHYMRDIEVKGVQNLKKFFKGKVKMISIFLDVPDDVLVDRLRKRGESEERIVKRLSRGKLERSYKDLYGLVVENYDLDKTVKTISDFIDSQME